MRENRAQNRAQNSNANSSRNRAESVPPMTVVKEVTNPPNPPSSETERLAAWREQARRTPGVRSVEAWAQHGYKTGEWPVLESIPSRHDPSFVCEECGETFGAGHLESCPRMPGTLATAEAPTT